LLFSDTTYFETITESYKLFEGTGKPDKFQFLTIYDQSMDISEDFEEIAIRLAKKYPAHFIHRVYNCEDDPGMCPEPLKP
jgi:hypothetical protein